MRFIFGRLAEGLTLLLLVSAVAFAFCELAPGDFLTGLRVRPDLSGEALAQWENRYGLSQSGVERYLHWMGGIVRADFGMSMTYQQPVWPLLWPRAVQTIRLNLFGMVAAWGIALPLVFWVATGTGRWWRSVLANGMGALAGVPDLVLAIGALFIAVETEWFPTSGSLPLCVAVLTIVLLPAIFRQVNAGMVAALHAPHVEAARSRGLTENVILLRYAAPAAMNPVASVFGLSLSMLLSSSLVVEVVLSWPGLGPLLVEAVLARDTPLVMASVLLSGTFLLAGNLAGDLLLLLTDPRLRDGGRR